MNWISDYTHTHAQTRSYERMGTPFAHVVSDLCGPITQVSQWVAIKERVGNCGIA